MNKLHFISGLPRSGSTMLSAILIQNPVFHAGIMSATEGLFAAMLNAMSGTSDSALLMNADARPRVLRGLFENYYADKDVVFDTNRAWCSHVALLAQLFPRSKIVCMVRDVRWIMDSIERAVLKNPFYLSSIANYRAEMTVYDRIGMAANGKGMLGAPLNGLKQAYFGPFADRLVIVRYEDFVASPERTIGRLYDVLAIKRFRHDFDNLTFETEEFDRRLGTPGLHSVRRHVTAETRETILPPDVFNNYANDLAWLSKPSAATVLK